MGVAWLPGKRPPCPHCGGETVFYGNATGRGRRLLCRGCGKTSTMRGRGHRQLNREKDTDARWFLSHGFSIRATCRELHMGKDTVRKIARLNADVTP